MASLKKSNVQKEYGVGLVRSTSFGRKRVALSDVFLKFADHNGDCYLHTTHSKRQCLQASVFGFEKPSLEDMNLEILIRIVCGTDHDDLKSLLFVSKAFQEATMIAKKSHFAYSTPRKRLSIDNIENLSDAYEIEAPNAPKQLKRAKSRLSAKKMTDISVSLFASSGVKNRQRKYMLRNVESGI